MVKNHSGLGSHVSVLLFKAGDAPHSYLAGHLTPRYLAFVPKHSNTEYE